MSISSKSLTVVIPFDGTSAAFGTWRKRIRAAFKVRGWDKYLTASSATPQPKSSSASSSSGGASSISDPAEQKLVDAAYGSLVESLPLDLIAAYTSDDPDSEHPTVLWQSILAHFESTSMANRAHLRSKLASIQLTTTYLAFYTEVMAIVHTLKSMNENVSDAEITYLILKGLTSGFEMVKTVLQHDKNLTVESMHRALTVRAEQMALDDSAPRSDGTFYNGPSSQGSKARTSNTSGGPARNGPDCWTCGQHGHRAFDCPQNAKKSKCGFCRSIGSHNDDQCRRKRSSNQSSNPSNNHSSTSNQSHRGKFVKSTNAGPPAASSSTSGRNHDAQHYNQQEYDSEDESFFLGVEMTSTDQQTNAVPLSTNSSTINPLAAYNYTRGTTSEPNPARIQSAASARASPATIELVLDSATSISTCRDQSLLIDPKPVKPIRVKVASGETVTLDQAGSLRVSLDAPGAKTINIPDVYYAPNCPVNLLSIGAMTKRGKQVTFSQKGACIRRSDKDGAAAILTVPAVGNLFAVTLRAHGQKTGMHPVIPVEVPTIDLRQTREPKEELDRLYRLWHSRLGHISKTQLAKLVRSESISGLSLLKDLDFNSTDQSLCNGCELGKACRKSFSRLKQGEPAAEILDRFHADIKGPINVSNMSGERYVLMVTDEKSRRSFVFLLKNKSDATECIVNLCKRSQVETGKTLREFHSDNGTEFVNRILQSFFDNQGTRFTTTTPGTPQHNPIAERLNRTVFDKVRSMLFHAQLPPYFWGFAVLVAVQIKNKTLTSINGGLTPETIWRQQSHTLNQRSRSDEIKSANEFKTSVKRMRVFGCNVYCHLQNQTTTQPRSAKGIFVGYDDEAHGYYRILDLESRKIIKRRDVHFDEDNFSFVREYTSDKYRPVEVQGEITEELNRPTSSASNKTQIAVRTSRAKAASENQESDTESNPDTDIESDDDNKPSVPVSIPAAVAAPSPTPAPPQTPKPAKKPKTVFDAVRATNIVNTPRPKKVAEKLSMSVSSSDQLEEEYNDPEPHFTPKTFKQAMECKNAQHWQDAATGEVEAMQLTRSYELVPRPPNANVIDSKWVWKKKLTLHGRVKRFRARLTARGFKQIKDLDYFETFAPVMRYKSFKMLCAIAGKLGYRMRHLDVPKAFLRADLKEAIYMEQPEGFHNGNKNQVWKLLKSVYGIKQAPNNWNDDLNQFIISLGFTRCTTDTCIYVKRSRTGRLMAIGVFVDDIIPIFGESDEQEWNESLQALKDKYDIEDTGDAEVVLGMRVTRDYKQRTIKLDQASYIAKLLKEFQLSDCKVAPTPTNSYILSKADCPQTPEEENQIDKQQYQQMVGALNYAAISTRPDIQFAVGVLSRYLQNPGSAHVTACKRVFRYLKGTPELGIVLGGTEPIEPELHLTAYSDSDWAGNHDDRRSTTGFVIQLSGSVISWTSKRQSAVALSSCEAEYYAISAAVAEIKWIRQFLEEVLRHDKQLQQSRVVTRGLVDNQSAMSISKNDVHHNRTKHIDIRHHFVRDAITDGIISLKYIPTEDQLADILTKGLGRVAFQRLRDQLMG